MGKTLAQKVLDRVVAVGLTPVLRGVGFKKAGRNFRRTVGRCIQVGNVQASAFSWAEQLKFTLNLGVYYPEVHELRRSYLQWAPKPSGPLSHECQLQKRIGELLPRSKDTWWTVAATDSPESVAREVTVAVEQYGLPWLDAMADFELARRHAGPEDAVAFAVLAGDRDEARLGLPKVIRAFPEDEDLKRWGIELGLEKAPQKR